MNGDEREKFEQMNNECVLLLEKNWRDQKKKRSLLTHTRMLSHKEKKYIISNDYLLFII